LPEYYLDIETTGLDPKKDKIITIQYQRLGMLSGREEGPLTILRSWDLDARAKNPGEQEQGVAKIVGQGNL
jgi:hypothetical protein